MIVTKKLKFYNKINITQEQKKSELKYNKLHVKLN
jgi:hypothetical protein